MIRLHVMYMYMYDPVYALLLVTVTTCYRVQGAQMPHCARNMVDSARVDLE